MTSSPGTARAFVGRRMKDMLRRAQRTAESELSSVEHTQRGGQAPHGKWTTQGRKIVV